MFTKRASRTPGDKPLPRPFNPIPRQISWYAKNQSGGETSQDQAQEYDDDYIHFGKILSELRQTRQSRLAGNRAAIAINRVDL